VGSIFTCDSSGTSHFRVLSFGVAWAQITVFISVIGEAELSEYIMCKRFRPCCFRLLSITWFGLHCNLRINSRILAGYVHDLGCAFDLASSGLRAVLCIAFVSKHSVPLQKGFCRSSR